VFAGKLDGLAAPVDKLAADLAAFGKQLSAPSFKFAPQGLLNGATKLAYEIGENKSKGGESPFAGTSLSDMYENVESIEAVYKLVFDGALKARDPKLTAAIVDKIEDVETLVKVKDLKSVNQPALKKAGKELAVLLQSAARSSSSRSRRSASETDVLSLARIVMACGIGGRRHADAGPRHGAIGADYHPGRRAAARHRA
jgi:hypothetical protein